MGHRYGTGHRAFGCVRRLCCRGCGRCSDKGETVESVPDLLDCVMQFSSSEFMKVGFFNHEDGLMPGENGFESGGFVH